MKQDPSSRHGSMPLLTGRDHLVRRASPRSRSSRFGLRVGFPLLLMIILFGQMLGTGTIRLGITGAGAPGISAFSKQSLEDHYNDINNQVDGYSPAYAYQQCQRFYVHQNVQC